MDSTVAERHKGISEIAFFLSQKRKENAPQRVFLPTLSPPLPQPLSVCICVCLWLSPNPCGYECGHTHMQVPSCLLLWTHYIHKKLQELQKKNPVSMRNMISQKNFGMSTPHTDSMELRNEHQDWLPPDFFFGNKCPLGYSTVGGVTLAAMTISSSYWTKQGRRCVGFLLKQQLCINCLVFAKHGRNRERIKQSPFRGLEKL